MEGLPRMIVKKWEQQFFPANECELDEFWNDLIENGNKKKQNENCTTSNKRHTLRSKE